MMMMDEAKKDQKHRKTWRDAIAVTEKILTVTAIWPVEDKSLVRTLKITFFAIAIFIFDISIVIELRNLMLTQDYKALSTHLSTFGLYIAYTIKIIIFHFKQEGFKSMLAIIGSPVFDEYPPSMQKYKDNCIFVSKGISLFYICFVWASIFMYLNKPLYTELPLPISFSYDLNPITYDLILALQCFSVYFLVITGITFDMTNIGLINIATAQLDILSETIASFRPQLSESLEREEHVFLSKCADRHRTIIRFANQTENVFTFLLLTQCLASVTAICNGAFQLTHTGELLSLHFIFNCAFFFDVFVQIGIICWFAGQLTIKSLEVADACYNYNWLNSSTRTKKLLLIIMVRSQTPLYFTAGKFAKLSMSSFLTVLKTAYSYFALMQSLYDKKNVQLM